MKKVNLYVYKDKINKLHKAALAFKEAYDNYNDYLNNDLLSDDNFDINTDWDKLSEYMNQNPQLSDKLDEVEKIVKEAKD